MSNFYNKQLKEIKAKAEKGESSIFEFYTVLQSPAAQICERENRAKGDVMNIKGNHNTVKHCKHIMSHKNFSKRLRNKI